MKRLFSTLLCAIIAFSAFAQSEHLTFKGVPIDGTLNEYIDKMKEAGFDYIGKQDGMAILMGDFAGYKGCIIGVNTLQSLDIVNMIGVIFPEADDWSTLTNTYEHLKSMLTLKYGRHNDCVEEFQGYSQPRTDNDRLHKLKFDSCTWYTIFRTDKGNIELSIDHNSSLTCYVMLRYFDRINTNAVEQQAINDL